MRKMFAQQEPDQFGQRECGRGDQGVVLRLQFGKR
jgi:hypothetical protein